MPTHPRTRAAAFAPTDLAATLAAAAILACLAAAGLAETRRASQLDESIANLERIAAATGAYGADNADAIWGFSWQPGETHEYIDEDGDVVEITLPDDVLQAAAHQAVHIIRLTDDRVGDTGFSVPSAWMPHALYSHLPLVHYLGAHPLDRWTADPGDRVRLNWKDDPVNKFDNGFWLPLQPPPHGASSERWPYSSSYQPVPATWDTNQSKLGDEYNFGRFEQGSNHATWFTPPEPDTGIQSLAGVAYPGAKVHVHDIHQRHFGPRRAYFGLDEARVPVATFDGAVAVRRTADANPGWRPPFPNQPCTIYFYVPKPWEPATVGGGSSDKVKGVYRWTRAGLKGVDFGGLPLDTGQKTPGECDS